MKLPARVIAVQIIENRMAAVDADAGGIIFLNIVVNQPEILHLNQAGKLDGQTSEAKILHCAIAKVEIMHPREPGFVKQALLRSKMRIVIGHHLIGTPHLLHLDCCIGNTVRQHAVAVLHPAVPGGVHPLTVIPNLKGISDIHRPAGQRSLMLLRQGGRKLIKVLCLRAFLLRLRQLRGKRLHLLDGQGAVRQIRALRQKHRMIFCIKHGNNLLPVREVRPRLYHFLLDTL